MKLFPAFLIACLPVFGFIKVTAATNAAGYQRNGMPSAGLALGSYVSIFGTELADGAFVQRGYPLVPAGFNNVKVFVVSKNLGYEQKVTYTSPTQVGVIITSTTPLGPAVLRVINGSLSSDLDVNIINRNFGVFAVNQGGSGPAVAYKYAAGGSASLVTLFESAAPGQLISLYGTGLGPTSEDDGLPVTQARDLPGNVEVYIGNKPATVSYKGRIPGISSIDQLNVTVPLDVAPGCFVSVVVKTDSISNGTTLPVAAGGKNCSDDQGIRSADLDRAKASGGLNYGRISLLRSQFTETTGVFTLTESISASFFRYSSDRLAAARPYASLGSCVLFDSPGLLSATSTTTSTSLDAGSTMTVITSAGTKTLSRSGGRYSYSGVVNRTPPSSSPVVPEFLVAGAYTMSANGGTDVGVTTASITRPGTFNWTNFSSVNAVNRTQDLEVTWSGAEAGSVVQIFGISSSSPATGVYQSGGFECTAPSGPGRFVIPAYVLQSIPVTVSIGGIPQSFISVSTQVRGTLTATGIDTGIAVIALEQGKTVPFN
ncbi:MAG: hypothetical protein ABIR70_02795 [Bryobacteraceae bacterium]